MPGVYEAASQFSPQTNTAPDLLTIETSFMKDGRAVSVDSDLTLRIHSLQDDSQIGGDITFNSTPKVEYKVVAGGVYYFARLNPLEFGISGPVAAKWYARINGQTFQPSPVVSVHNVTHTAEQILLTTELRDWTLRKLGWPKVAVELTEAHIMDCINDALTDYGRWYPVLKYGLIRLVASQKRYPIPECGRGVLYVDFRRKEGNPIVSDPLFGRDYPRWTNLDFDHYVLATSFYETLLRTTGQEPIWRWEPTDPLAIYIDVGDAARSFYHASYMYAANRRLEEVNPAHHFLFKQIVLAHSKIALGQVREKFGDQVMTAQGSVSLNGRALKDEGNQELERLTEDLKGLQLPLWPQRW